MPIVSYFEVGTILTPNHGHASFMGVFGMLGVALLVFACREVVDESTWLRIEKYVRASFWGLNLGLASMITFNLFPGGVMQLYDVLQNGYWHARPRIPGHNGGSVCRMGAAAGRFGIHFHRRCAFAVDNHEYLPGDATRSRQLNGRRFRTPVAGRDKHSRLLRSCGSGQIVLNPQSEERRSAARADTVRHLTSPLSIAISHKNVIYSTADARRWLPPHQRDAFGRRFLN